jgi:hypothetical protein
MTEVAKHTVLNLLRDIGCASAAYHHRYVRKLRVRRFAVRRNLGIRWCEEKERDSRARGDGLGRRLVNYLFAIRCDYRIPIATYIRIGGLTMGIKTDEPVNATGWRRYATHAGPNGPAPDAFSFGSHSRAFSSYTEREVN